VVARSSPWQACGRGRRAPFGEVRAWCLVDRLDLWLYPVLLGSGKRVFGEGTVPTALRLIESVTYPNGTLQLTYETAGTPTYSTIAT
jgi:hypothetical protein